MILKPLPEVAYTVLGFLDEYLAHQFEEGSNLIQMFRASEAEKADRFAEHLERLATQAGLPAQIDRRTDSWGKITFCSPTLAPLINSVYVSRGMVPITITPEPGEADPVLHGGMISYAVFPPDDRNARIAFIRGAYQRYGLRNTFTFINADHKVKLIERLLQELGSPRVNVTRSETIPATNEIEFEPTTEMLELFKN